MLEKVYKKWEEGSTFGSMGSIRKKESASSAIKKSGNNVFPDGISEHPPRLVLPCRGEGV